MFLMPDRGIALAGRPPPTGRPPEHRHYGDHLRPQRLGPAGGRHRQLQRRPSVTLQPGQTLRRGRRRHPQPLRDGRHARPRQLHRHGDRRGGAERHPEHTRRARAEHRVARRRNASPPTRPFAQPGTPVDVSATLQVAVNEPRPLSAQYTVTNPTGTVVFTSPRRRCRSPRRARWSTVDLGSFPTTGLADGLYAIAVTVTDTSAQPLPAATGQGSLTIGLPVTRKPSR